MLPLKADTTTDIRLKPDSTTLTLRAATVDDAPAIHDLISSYIAEGHLLPRTLSEIAVHAHRFVLAVDEAPLKGRPTGAVVGCVDLAPLSRTVAEVRSLVVSDELRSNGVGRRLIDAVVASARRAGFERICAFTHAPSYFVQRGFSLVPHEWLPEKIRTDCGSCALFRRCRQYAVVLPLARVTDACVPLASLHG
jgi:amino-acid N-acetyltransferase